MADRKELDVDGIIFDFDGTLAELNIDFPALYRRVFDLAESFNADTTSLTQIYLIEVIEEIARSLGEDQGGEFSKAARDLVETEEVSAAREASLFQGSRDLLKALKNRGKKIGVVTRNCVKAVLTVYPDVEGEVDVLLARDHVNRIKPHPDHLKEALSRLSLPRDTVALVGDHPIDIISARKALLIPVGVLTGRASYNELAEAGADLILDTAPEIIEYIA
jgi:phosphoglycolate phosphatase